MLENGYHILIIALQLAVIELLVFGYYCKRVLKRIPEYDIDFLVFWLEIVNTFLGVYLGSLQTFGKLNKNPCQIRPLRYVQSGQLLFADF